MGRLRRLYVEDDMNPTATEVLARLDEGTKRLAALQDICHDDPHTDIYSGMIARLQRLGYLKTVCARRARKLRKRGRTVVWAGYTTTGKIRYAVLPLLPEWDSPPNAKVSRYE